MKIEFHGSQEIIDNLKHSAERIVKSGLAYAGDQALIIMERAILDRVPVDKGTLESDLEIGGETYATGYRGWVGFRGMSGLVAMWLEYGHFLIGHAPEYKQLLGRIPGHNLGSPFEPAHPFLRPAFEASAERAQERFAEIMNEVFKRDPWMTQPRGRSGRWVKRVS